MLGTAEGVRKNSSPTFFHGPLQVDTLMLPDQLCSNTVRGVDGLPKETVIAIMMLYKNTKVKVYPAYRVRDFFDIIVGVLQGVKLAPHLFLSCRDYMLRTSIYLMKKCLYTRKGKKQTLPRTNYYGRGLRWWHSASDKLVAKFTNLGSSVSSNENDINMRRAKACLAIDMLLVISKSDLSDKIKHIFPNSNSIHTTIWMHHIDAD